MKTNSWFAALSPFLSAVVALATGGRDDARIPDQFQQSTWRKHLGCLLISTMRASQTELRAIPQFDAGRWELRLERVPSSTDKQFTGPVGSSIAVGFTVLSPLICLIAVYLWARVIS